MEGPEEGVDMEEETGGGSAEKEDAKAAVKRRRKYEMAEYWDERYEKTSGVFDWYTDFLSLKPLFAHYCKLNSRILNLGCGNSELAEGLALEGYTDVTSVDISGKCIDMMLKRCQESKHAEKLKDLRWIRMDASRMTFEDKTFDFIIEKGTMDALVCNSETGPTLTRILAEAHRVLRIGGTLVVITYGNPDSRMALFKDANCPWRIKVRRVPYSPSALLIRTLRAMLNGKPLRCVSPEMLAVAMPKVKQELANFETAEDLGPEKSPFCYGYCCTKVSEESNKPPAAPAVQHDNGEGGCRQLEDDEQEDDEPENVA
uniref:Methyltransferase type 11 domain-containing protein n=1 Tax=Lotharella oceanica TaxID=641309 RepID=A0A7S2TWQ3_9EUKA